MSSSFHPQQQKRRASFSSPILHTHSIFSSSKQDPEVEKLREIARSLIQAKTQNTEMAGNLSPSSRSCLFLIWVVVLASLLASAVHGGGLSEHGHRLGWAGAARSHCEGSIAECLAAGGDGEGEFDLDSESNRRILATSNYISYGALQRNTVPCSRRGASYYNCRPGASSNPYSRGCSAIARCRG